MLMKHQVLNRVDYDQDKRWPLMTKDFQSLIFISVKCGRLIMIEILGQIQ